MSKTRSFQAGDNGEEEEADTSHFPNAELIMTGRDIIVAALICISVCRNELISWSAGWFRVGGVPLGRRLDGGELPEDEEGEM